MDREGMDAGLQLGRKRGINHAVTRQPALPPEGLGHDIDSEMGFAALPMAGMTLVAIRLVEHFEAQR